MKKSENKTLHIFGGKHFKEAPSSYNREKANILFELTKLKKGETFVDLGCGTGNYSLHAARLVEKEGKVIAIDSWSEMLDKVKERAKEEGFQNITTIENNICESITVDNNSVDVCFISNVLHGQKLSGKYKQISLEIVRILKDEGRLVVIEFKKEAKSPGPPINIRISPEELEEHLSAYGFQKSDYLDLGHLYMMIFVKN